MNEGDARQASDAELLEQWLEGRVRESDPKVGDLFHRRPEWRELAQHVRSSAEEDPAAWSGAASEADRRLVAECFADARSRGPISIVARDANSSVRETAAQKHWPRLLLALAAVLVVSWLAWMWWSADRAPQRKSGQLLGSEAPLNSDESGTVTADFSEFAWKEEALKSGETFELTIWADADGVCGRQLSRTPTHAMSVRFSLKDIADWPESVIWRVDRIDSIGMKSYGKDHRAHRTVH